MGRGNGEAVTHLAVIFGAGLFTVFLLGFQSRCVNHGNYRQAACCSFTIAMFQGTLWGALFHDLSLSAKVAYGLSGAVGITASMFVHQRMQARNQLAEAEKQIKALKPAEMLALASALVVLARAKK